MSNFKFVAALAVLVAAGGWLANGPARAESVMKECGAEWKAAKAANTTNGQTWQEYLKDCKARHASTGAAAAPAAAPAPAPSPTPTTAPAPKPTVAAAPTGAGQFASEGEAKGKCPTDTVVWVNNTSRKYHMAGDRYYGKTKHGAYMCEGDAKAAGDVAAKSRMKSKS
jgi:hypothetical protein